MGSEFSTSHAHMWHIAKGLLKLTFSIGALVFIFGYLQIDLLLEKISQLGIGVILVAFLLNAVSQLFASERFHYYCTSKAIEIKRKKSYVLYFIGMFFNHLLPGGIGGDGYVAIMLKRNYASALKTNIQILLSARASGLLLLILVSAILACYSQSIQTIPNGYLLLLLGSAATILIYAPIVKRLLAERYAVQFRAAIYSLGVQGFIALSTYVLLLGMNIEPELMLDYTALLVFSSILILIPISFGGLGLRELGFLYASQLLGLNAEVGVAISLLYYSFNLTLSLVGLGFFMSSKRK